MICKECGEEKKIEAKGLCRRCYDKKNYNSEKNKVMCSKFYQNNKEKLKIQNSLNYQKNREEVLKKQKEYSKTPKAKQVRKNLYEENKEKILEQNKQTYKKYEEKYKKQQKEWREKPGIKLRLKKYGKKYYGENRRMVIDGVLKYQLEHRKERSIYWNRWSKEKTKNDFNYRLKRQLSIYVQQKIKNGLGKKQDRFIKLLDCSISFFKKYIKERFEIGMSWDIYGVDTWHLDHIIPCSSFDLTKLEEQKKCFHYTNYQPLWAKDNLQKGAKLDWVKNDM